MAGQRKILLVEDDLYIRDIYSKVLAQAGYQVKQVNDGNAALAEILNFKPDLVLLDIMVPGIDGLEVLRKLKQEPAYKSIHPLVVMVTNLAQSESADTARRLGADGYVIKADIAPNDLVATVKSYEKLFQ